MLSNLKKEVRHHEQQKAHLAAAKPLIEREKLLAPEGPTGNLVDSIGGVKISLKRAEFIGEVHVGPRTRRPYRGFHGRFVEFGTRARILKGRGKYPFGTSRGVMPARPFVAPAFRQTHQQVLNGIYQATTKRIVTRMRRDAVKI